MSAPVLVPRKSSPKARIAAGFRQIAEALEEWAAEEAQPVPAPVAPRQGLEMLTPEEACALVAGRDENGKPRIHEKTLTRRTRSMAFRRKIGGKVVYERAGLEKWARTQ